MASPENSLRWHAAHLSVIGAGHVANNTPCQDASLATTDGRPLLIVCDGRGSAARSHEGSRAATEAFARLVEDAAPMLTQALDADCATDSEAPPRAWAHFAQLTYSALGNVSKRLARLDGTKPSDYDFTLVAAVIGARRLGWLHVGDGFLAIEHAGAIESLSSADNGEFANQTHFVRPNGEGLRHLRHGVTSLNGVTGVAAASDGCEPLLFDVRSGAPANAFAQLFASLRDNPDSDSHRRLLSLPLWDDHTRDDRSLALLARSACSLAISPNTASAPEPTRIQTEMPLSSPTPDSTSPSGSSVVSTFSREISTNQAPPRPSPHHATRRFNRHPVILASILLLCGGFLWATWQLMQDSPPQRPESPPPPITADSILPHNTRKPQSAGESDFRLSDPPSDGSTP